LVNESSNVRLCFDDWDSVDQAHAWE